MTKNKSFAAIIKAGKQIEIESLKAVPGSVLMASLAWRQRGRCKKALRATFYKLVSEKSCSIKVEMEMSWTDVSSGASASSEGGDAALWVEARQVDSKARALLLYCQLQFCVRSWWCGGCTWVKSSGVNNDVIVVGKLFWRTPYAFRHEQRIINKLGRHNDAANVT